MARWVIDPDHTVAAFSIRHMMITNVRGQFNTVNGTIDFDPEDITRSKVDVTIGVAGIWTGIAKRDEHLRSPDFFDVATYPHITFTSTRVEPSVGNGFRVHGDLSIRDTTKEVAFEAEWSGPKTTDDGDTCIGFSAVTVVNREDFGITWNYPLPGGGVMVGTDVTIHLDAEADLVS